LLSNWCSRWAKIPHRGQK